MKTAHLDLSCSELSVLTCIPQVTGDRKFIAISFICHTEKLIIGPQLLAIKGLHVDPQLVFAELCYGMDPLVPYSS